MIFRFFRKSFSRRLILLCITTMLIPLIINTSISYYYSTKIMENRTYDYLHNLATVTMSKVELSVNNVVDTAFFIAGNSDLQQYLATDTTQKNREDKYRLYSDTRNVLSYYVLLSKEISAAYIDPNNGPSFSYSKIPQSQPPTEVKDMDQEWICVDHRIYLKRTLRQFQTHSELGTLIVESVPSVFYNIVKDISFGSENFVYIIDEDQTIISAKDREMTGQQLPEYLASALKSDTNLTTVDIDHTAYSVYIGKEISNGWRLVLAIPKDYFLSDIRSLRTFTIILSLIIFGIAVCISIFTGKSFSHPIKELSDSMERFGQGDFDVSCHVDTQDELAVLGNTFNQMVHDIQTLINNMYEQEILKQDIEMKSLQMQINPHFLYNTLDTINWIARMHGLNEIGDMTAALGNLMRYSLSKKDFVTIEEELANLKNYVEIQNTRYGDRMSISYHIAPDVLHYYIPKLLLQPILENAIVHGVEDKLEPAHIDIRIYHEGEELFLIVEDDGVGMGQEAIESLINPDLAPKKGHTSIGVYNVHRRIQKVCGKNYGLLIQSQLGAGTKVTLRMKTMLEVPDIHLRYNN